MILLVVAGHCCLSVTVTGARGRLVLGVRETTEEEMG
jgi:hypothetical protein